jgi:hypothetical protein
MDFVADRAEARKLGWRSRISEFLKEKGVIVFDPWNKPEVAGMPHYGKEDEFSTNKRNNWSFENSLDGEKTRAELSEEFWPTMHIDLRMVDYSDFLIAYCPTNIYSVGTVHEIVMARLQFKPVLFVSPPVTFPMKDELSQHLNKNSDKKGLELLEEFLKEIPLKPNPNGIPSMWYMALIDSGYFFDGFGFAEYGNKWEKGPLDEREELYTPKRPLLPYLENLNKEIPKRYDPEQDAMVENADWLIFNT